MSIAKKIVLGLSVALTMAIAFVVGLVGLNPNKAVSGSVVEQSSTTKDVQAKPISYTYQPNQVQVVSGSDTLRFEYQPDGLTKDSSTVKAYEYMFGSTMDTTMAINLKYINTTDVEVSYVYSATKLDTTQSITGETSFTLQTLENRGDKVYIYILVSPTNENIPATFTQDITWWFGELGEMNITNPMTNEKISKPVVAGQPIDDELIKSTFNISDDVYISGYFYDKECTKLASNQIQTRPLYFDVANLPTDWLAYDSSSKSYYVQKGTSTLPSDLVIPTIYDGTNGRHIVTYIHNTYSSGSGGVFYNQTSLTSVKLPSTLTSIGYSAFYKCSGLTSINLPSSLTSISDYMFVECTSLTSITIPINVTKIGGSAFSSSGLQSIDLSGCISLTSIETGAFNGCTGLTSIVVPEGVTSIGNFAFQGCSGLTSITLPRSLTSIDGYLFNGCDNLTSIVVESGNTVYDSRNNCNAIIETSTNTLIQGCKNTVIPNNITSIGYEAFYQCGGLTSIIIPESVTSIGNNAFYNCRGLTSITLPSGLTSIGNYVFYQCSGLTSITLPSSLTSIGKNAFNGCSSLASITFEQGGTWYYTSSTDYTGGTEFAIATDTNYATEFKSTYYNYYWYKV